MSTCSKTWSPKQWKQLCISFTRNTEAGHRQANSTYMSETKRSKDPTHLQVEGKDPQSPNGSEEEEGDRDLDDEGAHNAELLKPHGELVGIPGQGWGDALRFVVICQG